MNKAIIEIDELTVTITYEDYVAATHEATASGGIQEGKITSVWRDGEKITTYSEKELAVIFKKSIENRRINCNNCIRGLHSCNP